MLDIVSGLTPLVRTWFDDGDSWTRLVAAVRSPEAWDAIANVQILDDPQAARMSVAEIASLDPKPFGRVIIADERSMTDPGFPLLLARADGTESPEQLRVIATELYEVEINLDLANLDWEDFVDRRHADGVFRGFH